MTTCERIQADAAGLAALFEHDPERRAALSHAEGCLACRDALAAAERVIAALDALPAPPPPAPAVLRRVSLAVLDELQRPRLALMLASCAVLAWGLILATARHRAPGAGAWAQSAVAAAIAAAGAAGALKWGGRAVAAIAAASGLFAVLAGSGGELAVSSGIHCLLEEMATAALVLAPLVWLVATGRGQGRPELLAAVAAAGALAGHAALDLTCPAHGELAHVLAFHTGGVLLAAGLAGLTTRLGSRRSGHRPAAS